MTALDLIQGSPEWLAARAGSLGASRLADALATTKTGWGASRANLMAELVAERLTGAPAERFTSKEMQWGTEKEPAAREAYEWLRDVEVTQVGLIRHPSISGSHASPDGLVGEEGMLEIKCPNTATHIDTLLNGTIASRYVMQMQWQMICAGRQWCDFVSFDPRMPVEMQLFVQRVERLSTNEAADLEAKVSAFLGEVDAKCASLTAIYRKDLAHDPLP